MKNNILTSMNLPAAMLLLGLAFTTSALASCQSSNRSKEEGSLAFDSIVVEKKSKFVEVKVNADFPTSGSDLLRNTIGEYISESCGDKYNGSYANGDSVVAFYTNYYNEAFLKDVKEIGSVGSAYQKTISVKKVDEGKNYVSFETVDYEYSGGMRAYTITTGITIRKSDGRRFGYDMLKNQNSPEFRKLVKSGFKDYFKKEFDKSYISDEELSETLMNANVDYIDLPDAAPYITKDGVKFSYGEGEIAVNATGAPYFVIPFAKIAPYLTKAAQDMLE